MDNLEKFILENRDAFDTKVPNLSVWGEIDRQLEHRPVQRIIWMKRLRVAAAIALLVTGGGVIGAYLANSGQEVKSLADVSPEHAEMERYFNTQVSEKMAQLTSYQKDQDVQGDLQELDSMYEQLQRELKDAPPGAEEKIIQAMINNYQTKIDILEQVLEKVKTINPTNSKTAENEISI
jgi:hypothetical protein